LTFIKAGSTTRDDVTGKLAECGREGEVHMLKSQERGESVGHEQIS
jgi:hypothetical protein